MSEENKFEEIEKYLKLLLEVLDDYEKRRAELIELLTEKDPDMICRLSKFYKEDGKSLERHLIHTCAVHGKWHMRMLMINTYEIWILVNKITGLWKDLDLEKDEKWEKLDYLLGGWQGNIGGFSWDSKGWPFPLDFRAIISGPQPYVVERMKVDVMNWIKEMRNED